MASLEQTVVYDPHRPVQEQLKLESNMSRMQPFVFENLNYGVSIQAGWSKHCSYINKDGYELSGPEWDFHLHPPTGIFPVHRSTTCEVSVFRLDASPVQTSNLNDMLTQFEEKDAVVKADLGSILSGALRERILRKWSMGGISFLRVEDCTELLNAFHAKNMARQ